MSKPEKKTSPAMGAGAALLSIAALGVALVSHSTLPTRVEQEVQRQVPAIVAAATADLEREKQSLVVAANLKGWELAEENMPAGRNIYGSLNAEYTLVEFSDLECSFCKRYHSTPKDLVQQTGGRVNWEWQHLPLGFHNPVSNTASHAALCVSEISGNKAFWAFTQLWFDASALGGRGAPNVSELAANVGAPQAEFQACMDSQRHQGVIDEHVARAEKEGITGTPGTYVVDNTTGNRVFVRGAQPASSLLAAIKQLQGMRDSAGDADG